MTSKGSLNTASFAAVLTEIAAVPDEVDGISMVDAKREATFKVGAALNAVKVLRKLSAA